MTSKYSGKSGMSRRNFVKATAAAAGASILKGAQAHDHDDDDHGFSCNDSADLALVNGRFLTMNPKNPVVSAVAIRNGRFAEIGHADDLGRCARTINLRGATVIPGLIDSHCHFIRDGLNPGYEVRALELAATIAELQSMISTRAKTVPAGQFISCVSGWNINGLAEKRLPTVAELDAAAPNNPIYILSLIHI